jgi:hypothetical protein
MFKLRPRHLQDDLLLDTLNHEATEYFDPETRNLYLNEMQRLSHRFLLPTVRLFSLSTVAIIKCVKFILPFEFSSHRLMDILLLAFIRHCMSPSAARLIIIHYLKEAQLIHFVSTNLDLALPPDQTPTSIAGLDHGSVFTHDRNMYTLIRAVSHPLSKALQHPIMTDFNMPAIDTEANQWRLCRLDIETASYLMLIAFCLLSTRQEYNIAINSLNLDGPLMRYLSHIMTDAEFLAFIPPRAQFQVYLKPSGDIIHDLMMHNFALEYAHTKIKHVLMSNDHVTESGFAKSS